jgi:hypothetical protein
MEDDNFVGLGEGLGVESREGKQLDGQEDVDREKGARAGTFAHARDYRAQQGAIMIVSWWRNPDVGDEC